MCRVLMYLGEPTLVDDFLYKTDSSLIKQTYQPQYMSLFSNLAGFGMAAWDFLEPNANAPYLYRTTNLPFFDKNLKQLATKIDATCLLAHVRGTFLDINSVISEQNVHPFMYDDYNYALAHNGNLYGKSKMKFDLMNKMKPEIARKIKGTTDTELVYGVLLSQLEKHTNYSIEEMIEKVLLTIKIIQDIRSKNNICEASALNLFITNGLTILATRYVFGFGSFINSINVEQFAYHSLWYTFGEKYGFFDDEYKMKFGENTKSIIIASEPLTHNATTWFEVPEYFIMGATIENGQLKIYKHYINI